MEVKVWTVTEYGLSIPFWRLPLQCFAAFLFWVTGYRLLCGWILAMAFNTFQDIVIDLVAKQDEPEKETKP